MYYVTEGELQRDGLNAFVLSGAPGHHLKLNLIKLKFVQNTNKLSWSNVGMTDCCEIRNM